MSLVTARSESCCNSAWAEDHGIFDGLMMVMMWIFVPIFVDVFFSDVNEIWKLNGISMECSCFFLRVYIWDLNGFDGILMKKHVQSPYQLGCM